MDTVSRSAKLVLTRQKGYWRLLWLAVLIAHTPATISAVTRILAPHAEANVWSSFVLLSASHLFFLLEILFAPSLKLLTDRRCAIVFLLIVALLHVGVIQHGLPGLIAGPEANLWLLFTTVGLAWHCLAQAARRAVGVQFGFLEACRLRAAAQYAGAASLPPKNPHSGYLRAPLRAPPIVNS